MPWKQAAPRYYWKFVWANTVSKLDKASINIYNPDNTLFKKVYPDYDNVSTHEVMYGIERMVAVLNKDPGTRVTM